MHTWVVVREGRVARRRVRQAAVDPGGDLLGVVARKPRNEEAGRDDNEGHEDADAEQVHRPAADVHGRPEGEQRGSRDGAHGRKVDDDVIGLERAKAQLLCYLGVRINMRMRPSSRTKRSMWPTLATLSER